LKAAEYCRRLLADMARIRGLNQSVAERLAPARHDDLDPRGDGDGPYDELGRYRLRRVGIGIDDGDFVDTTGRGRSRVELARDADEALNA
jgi:hypothetical protein